MKISALWILVLVALGSAGGSVVTRAYTSVRWGCP